MGVAGAAVAGASATRPAMRLVAAAARQRALLRPADRLCLALSPAQVSAVANGLYDLPPVALARGLAARPRGITPWRPPAGGTPRRPLRGDYGQPECENDGRIRGYQRIRRGQAGQGPET